LEKEMNLARNPYQHEKRRKELARKKKSEDKRERKLAKRNPQPEGGPESASGAEETASLAPSSPLPAQPETAPCSPNIPGSPEPVVLPELLK
jgi:hypothetical protein